MLLGNQSKTKYYVVENLTSIWMASSNGRWRIFLLELQRMPVRKNVRRR